MTSIDEKMHLAMQLQHAGQLEPAEMLLNQILEAHPTHAEALHLLGIIAYQVNKTTLGIQLVERAIQSNPHVALFYSNLGEMHRKLNAIPLSIQYGQQAVALNPHSATALSNLGIAYYDAKYYVEAEACHQQALAMNPQLTSSLNNMGSIYKALNQTQEAITFYQAAIASAPQFAEPLNNLGVLLLQQQAFQPASTYLSQAIMLAPAFVEAQCNMGFALLGLDKDNNALIYFEKALQLKPDYAEAYYGMAKVYLNQHHFIESEYAIQKAIAINAGQTEFYQLLATIYQEQSDYTQALMYLDHALHLDAACTNAYLSKGNVLMEMGEISQAEAYFLKGAADSDINTQVLSHYSLVQLHKVKPDNLSLNHLRSIINSPLQAISPSKLEYAYFALGKCYDDMGEWTKAFKYFSLGCRIKRSRITYNIAEQIEFTNKLIHCFTKETIEYLQKFSNPSAVPIFIVGMPRSGTTLVEHVLSSHSHVHGAGELKYLSNLIQQPIKKAQKTIYYPENVLQFSPETCHTITNNYLSCLQRFSSDARHITDKMPHNFIAIGLIHALFPNAKIIHVERNPIDTCLSCYTKLFTQGQSYSYDLTELGQYYRCYEQIMAHWRNILPADAWLDIKYETMTHHFEEEAKRLIDFCDLPWEQACLTFYQSKRQVRTASFTQVRQPVYTSSVERWRPYEQELTPLIQTLYPQ
ncbi:MAG: sulfotransferase [Legionellaceae bacterium]|nr:sulfotransferase [Legionellaceae bacterium]